MIDVTNPDAGKLTSLVNDLARMDLRLADVRVVAPLSCQRVNEDENADSGMAKVFKNGDAVKVVMVTGRTACKLRLKAGKREYDADFDEAIDKVWIDIDRQPLQSLATLIRLRFAAQHGRDPREVRPRMSARDRERLELQMEKLAEDAFTLPMSEIEKSMLGEPHEARREKFEQDFKPAWPFKPGDKPEAKPITINHDAPELSDDTLSWVATNTPAGFGEF